MPSENSPLGAGFKRPSLGWQKNKTTKTSRRITAIHFGQELFMKSKTFEESLTRLEEILQQLDNGQLNLETALLQYEEGVHLLKYCHKIIESAQHKIEILRSGDDDDSIKIEPVDEKEFKTKLKIDSKMDNGQLIIEN
ncbi:MAG: exodeoxyribonuclease VII small subunit [Planctomycetaceae bacterium]|nr:exodeoxyribonuclease VII small subunit [Planctomycetaceae bacterium]